MGESCASYDNDVFTATESTPTQTSWALMGLIAGVCISRCWRWQRSLTTTLRRVAFRSAMI
jgi:hypothetical protein